MVSNESMIMAFPDPFVMLTFSKDSFPQFSLPFNSERWLSAASLVLAFRIILLHEFAPAFVATECRTTEAADGEKISSKADSISLKVSKLKRKCERALHNEHTINKKHSHPYV